MPPDGVLLFFIFISMFNEDIVEDERAICTEGGISWLSINIGSYQGKMVQVVDGEFFPCIGVSMGAEF